MEDSLVIKANSRFTKLNPEFIIDLQSIGQ